VGKRGAEAIAAAIETAGVAGALQSLNLSANQTLTASCVRALAKALPSSNLVDLQLAGINVSAHACGVLAASLPRARRLRRLDLSMNPFGCEGAWGLAWALPECHELVDLDLSSCEIGDDGADELLDALGVALSAAACLAVCPHLARLDLRGNKIDKGHALAADPRVSLEFQRPA